MAKAIVRGIVLAIVVPLFLYSLVAIVVTGPVVVRPARVELGVEVSPARLRETVERLCSEFSPRDHRHPDNLARAAGWIAERFAEAGLRVDLQEYTVGEGTFRNVVGVRAGAEPGAPSVVIGAHYDAWGGFPGADDNASGVAVLLELVRTLPADAPRRTRRFVAFATEEPPFFGTEEMGSAVYARSLAEAGVPVELMIALDMVGYFSDRPGSQDFPVAGLGLLYPRTGDFLAVVGDLQAGAWIKQAKVGLMTTTPLPVRSFRGPKSMAGVHWSDHRSFRELGMPGVLVTDTSFLRYPHYHAGGDTPERLDYERMAQVVLGLHGVLRD